MAQRPRLALLALVLSLTIASQAAAQAVEYTSPAGVAYRSLPDTGTIAKAQAALAADPKNIDLYIQLGIAQSGRTQFREAIETFTKGIGLAPDNAMLYRWRGHRHLSVREFDLAAQDLKRSAELDSTNYGAHFHLGIVLFARGDFGGAAGEFSLAQPHAPNPGELKGSTDWLWMSLSRAGRGDEAKAMLARHPDSLAVTPVGYPYNQRVRLYRGEITPDEVVANTEKDPTSVATVAFGIGNWYLVKGDTATAKSWFKKSVESGGWAGFGFIISEIELVRVK
jgi:Flp pilus assembly protein TadD